MKHLSDDELETTPMDRIVKAHQEAVAELREIRQRKRAVIAEEKQQEYYVAKLAKHLGQHEKELVKTKRPGDLFSMPVLMEKVLEAHPDGLPVTKIWAEVKKTGYETTAKNPVANLTTVLHRHKGVKFGQTDDGRWYLIRLGSPAPKLRVVQPNSNPHGEMVMKHGAPVPKELH
jgi:hypothetical protein